MQKFVISGLLVLLLGPTIICAAPAQLANISGEQRLINIIDNGSTGIEVTFDLPASAAQAKYEINSSNINEAAAGMALSKWIVMPARGSAELKVVGQEGRWAAFDEYGLAYRSESPRLDAAGAARLDPVQAARLGCPQLMRGVRLVPLFIEPLLFNAATGVAYETNYLHISIEWTPEAAENEFIGFPPPLARPFAQALSAMTLNPSPEWSPRRDLAAVDCGKMLVLYPSRLTGQNAQAALDTLTRFLNWKRRQGFDIETVAVDVQNLTESQIRDQIIFPRYRDNHIDYVLIIGTDLDYPQLRRDPMLSFPSFFIGRDTIQNIICVYNSDLRFGAFDGADDFLPEVIVARMMAPTTAKLIGALKRSMKYERDPFPGPDGEEGEWFGRALMLNDHNDPGIDGEPPIMSIGDIEFSHWGRIALNAAGYEETVQINGGRDEALAELVSALLSESGISLAVSNGYLWGSVNPDNINELTDTGLMNPFVIAHANHYGPPMLYPFFASCDARNYRGPVGAVGVFSFNWENYKIRPILAGAIKSIRYSDEWTPAEIYVGAMLEQTAAIEFARRMEFDTTTINHLIDAARLARILGDPTIRIYSSNPQEMTTDLPNTLPVGARAVSFRVFGPGGRPVEDARVCIRQDNDLRFVAWTDADGLAWFVIQDGLTAGSLMVTIDKHNFKSFTQDISVEYLDVNFEMVEWELNDANIGDGDGRLRNGERAALRLTVMNSGEADAENVFAEFSTDSPYLSFSRDRARMDNIASSESGGLAEAVNLILSPMCPGGTLVRVHIYFVCGEVRQEASFEFTSAGPNLKIETAPDTSGIWPGRSGDIRPAVVNRGDMASRELTAELVSRTSRVSVVRGAARFPAVAPAAAARTDTTFRIAIDRWFIPGNIAKFDLLLSSEDNFRQTIPFEIQIGNPRREDPLGPDSYGYLCFDSGDEGWPERPIYKWREINPDADTVQYSGTKLPMIDGSTSDGVSQFVRLPFPFTYYGRSFDSLVVNSNGWVSFDPLSIDFISHFNRSIPGAGAPNAQLCILWQNIKIEDDSFKGVYSHHLADEGIFVIEWSDVYLYQIRRVYNPDIGDSTTEEDVFPVDFEILFYNPRVWTTPSGDGEIVFQYRRYLPLAGNGVSEPEDRYPVVGIRNLDGSNGIQYTQLNHHHPQAGGLAVNWALKFTTDAAIPRGAVRGRIVSAANPQQGIEAVRLFHPRGVEGLSDVNGNFLLTGLREMAYENVELTKAGLGREWVSFEIAANETIDVQTIRMGQPQIRSDQAELNPNLRPSGGHRAIVDLTLRNTGSGNGEYNARIVKAGGRTESLDSLKTFPISAMLNNDGRVFGPVYIDTLFYIPHTRNMQISVVSINGRRIEDFTQPIPPPGSDRGFKNLTYDGELLWGSVYTIDDRSYIVGFTLEGERRASFTVEYMSNSGLPLTFCPERNSLFIADRDQDVMEIDREGNTLNRWRVRMPRQEFYPSGLAWNIRDTDGMPLYILDRYPDPNGVEGQYRIRLIKMNPQSGEYMLWGEPTQRFGISAGNGLTLVPNYRRDVMALAWVEDFGNVDWLRIHEIGPNIAFLTPAGLQNRRGVIHPDNIQSLRMEFFAEGLDTGLYRFAIRIKHNMAGDDIVVPVNFTISENAGVADDLNTPYEFELSALYPNPFNSMLSVRFSAPLNENARLLVYDLAGREVSAIWEGKSRGKNHIAWNAESIPSGVYIVQLTSAGKTSTQKVVLMR